MFATKYAANSPRNFPERLKDVADVTSRVMEADVCLIYRYDRKKDELVLALPSTHRSPISRAMASDCSQSSMARQGSLISA